MNNKQEILHIYSADGAPVAERDLASDEASVLVIIEDGHPAFTTAVDGGQTVLAALVRDEDGWTLAAAEPSKPVVSGARRENDIHLVAGLPCQIDGWIFRLERSDDDSGLALVWRYRGSPIAVDPVVAGRNIVSFDRTEKRPLVNPTLPDEELFEFYPTADGLDVTVSGNSSDRLSVGFNVLFSVGGFEGMLMVNADAAKAIKAMRPFAWPSRKIRRLVRLSVLAVIGVFVAAFAVRARVNALTAYLDSPRGAEKIEYVAAGGRTDAGDNITVYDITFYRMLPVILVVEPNAVTLDLIHRGELLASDPGVARKVKFLKDVRAIQETVKTGRWEEFNKVLDGIDEKMFKECDADSFLDDAKEVNAFLIKTIPEKIVNASVQGHSKDLDSLRSEVDRMFEALKGNIFLDGEIFSRERTNIEQLLGIVTAYVRARDQVLKELSADPPSCNMGSMSELYAAVSDAVVFFKNADDGRNAYSAAYERERGQLQDIVRRGVEFVLRRDTGDSIGAVTTMLDPLADLAEYVGLSGDEVSAWRMKAKAAAKKLDMHYRKLYSDYRMESGRDPAKAAKILDSIIAVGDIRNGFHTWALREKAKKEAGK